MDTRTDGALDRFSRVLQYRTVAARVGEPEVDRAFTGLLDFVRDAYPTLFARARVEREDPWQLVVELDGDDPSLDPLLLLAHFDVVDVEPGTGSAWTHPPFAGEIADGYVWGRGALDDKNAFVALLEATEALLASGATLRRGLVIACGGDEELSGRNGAARIAERMRERGRRFHVVLDEGAIVAVGMLSSPEKPIALIGVAEKGHANIGIRAAGTGGHAAMPPRRTALGHLASAVARIEARPTRPRLIPTVRDFFGALAPYARFPLRVVYRHARLFWPVLRAVLASSPESEALVRTTGAATMAKASAAPNVLPQSAEAIVNVRILPGETRAAVLDRYRRIVRRLPVEVYEVTPEDSRDPVAASPTDHPGYEIIREAATAQFDCVPAPFLVTGTTDSTWYTPLSDAVYRFVCVALDKSELGRIHGTDERISIDNFHRLVAFYTTVVRRECLHG